MGAGEVIDLMALAVIAIAVAIVLGGLSAQLFLRAADNARDRDERARMEERTRDGHSRAARTDT